MPPDPLEVVGSRAHQVPWLVSMPRYATVNTLEKCQFSSIYFCSGPCSLTGYHLVESEYLSFCDKFSIPTIWLSSMSLKYLFFLSYQSPLCWFIQECIYFNWFE